MTQRSQKSSQQNQYELNIPNENMETSEASEAK